MEGMQGDKKINRRRTRNRTQVINFDLSELETLRKSTEPKSPSTPDLKQMSLNSFLANNYENGEETHGLQSKMHVNKIKQVSDQMNLHGMTNDFNMADNMTNEFNMADNKTALQGMNTMTSFQGMNTMTNLQNMNTLTSLQNMNTMTSLQGKNTMTSLQGMNTITMTDTMNKNLNKSTKPTNMISTINLNNQVTLSQSNRPEDQSLKRMFNFSEISNFFKKLEKRELFPKSKHDYAYKKSKGGDAEDVNLLEERNLIHMRIEEDVIPCLNSNPFIQNDKRCRK